MFPNRELRAMERIAINRFLAVRWTVLLQCLCVLLMPVVVLAADLDAAMEVRPAGQVDVQNIDARSADGPGYSLFPIFDPITEPSYLQSKPFTGQPGGSQLTITLLAHLSGATDTLGVKDQNGTFIPIIDTTVPFGTEGTITQSPSQTFRFVLRNLPYEISSVDAENDPNYLTTPLVVVKRISSPGFVTVKPTNFEHDEVTVPIFPGDYVMLIEDQVPPTSDLDWNDTVILIRQTQVAPPNFSISGRAMYSDGGALAGVQVTETRSGKVATTDANGDYTISGLANGPRVLSAVRSGFSFETNPRVAAVDGANIANLDFRAATQLPRSPIFTNYNTFLNQWNFLELINPGDTPLPVRVTVYDISGIPIRVQDVPLNPRQEFDVNVAELAGKRDTYGVVRVDWDSSNANLLGRMSNYRPDDPFGSNFSFAFAREFREPVKGTTFATGNSYDPLGQGFLVPNWAEVTNLDSSTKSFRRRIYDQSGLLKRDDTFSVPPFGRFDISAGHELGEGVFLIQIDGLDPNAPYLASVSRYSSNAKGGNAAPTYNFAFSLDAKTGTGQTQFAPITNQVGDNWTQTNWVEVVNVKNTDVTASVVFKDENGTEVGRQAVLLSPLSQFHFNGSALLAKGRKGSVQVTGDVADSLIVQSLVYIQDGAANQLQTAYASTARSLTSPVQFGSVNTFLGMTDQIGVIATTSGQTPVDLTVRPFDGSTYATHVDLNGSQTVQIRSDQQGFAVPPDIYGTLQVSAPDKNLAVVENLRVRLVGKKVDFVMPTAVR